MWKIFAGVTAAVLITLLIFMNSGDRVESRNEASIPAAVETAVTPAAEPAPAPASSVGVQRTSLSVATTTAEKEASIDRGKPLPTRMSTTGTTFVLPKGHTPK